jgi:hypothetical protein
MNIDFNSMMEHKGIRRVLFRLKVIFIHGEPIAFLIPGNDES